MEISLAAESFAKLGEFKITNSLVSIWVVGWILILLSLIVSRRLHLVPRGLQNIFEVIIEFLLGLIENVTGDKRKARRFFPLVATIFIYILVNNYFGLLPGVGTIGFREGHLLVPLFRSANSDLNMTLALALLAVIATHIFGVVAIGLFKHAGKFINLKMLFKNPVFFFVGILELISEVSKVISFSFRLFGNIFAGEVLLIVIGGLVAYLAPVPFYFLELFVGFVQALVFAMLTLVFLTMATAEQH